MLEGEQVSASQRLREDAAALYADLRTSPFLRQLLSRSSSLMETRAVSISLVDPRAGCYHKVAELGTVCRLGHTFPLEEGITGRAVARRRPVLLDAYGDVLTSHLPAGHPAHGRPVVAVPIWWRGEVLGVNVAFAASAEGFSTRQVDRLEMLSQLAVAGIVHSGASDPSLAPLVKDALAGHDPSGHDAARHHPSGHDAAGHDAAGHDAAGHDGAAHEPGAGRPAPARRRGGAIPATVAALRSVPAPPFTEREREVLALLARGAGDRAIAEALVISPRTVEKHVSAVLRKTGTQSRTAAVMRCVAQGWLPVR